MRSVRTAVALDVRLDLDRRPCLDHSEDEAATARLSPDFQCCRAITTAMAAKIASDAETRFKLRPPSAMGFVNVSPKVAPSGRVNT